MITDEEKIEGEGVMLCNAVSSACIEIKNRTGTLAVEGCGIEGDGSVCRE